MGKSFGRRDMPSVTLEQAPVAERHKDKRAVMSTALFLCLGTGHLPAAIIARPIVGSVIAVVIGSDDRRGR